MLVASSSLPYVITEEEGCGEEAGFLSLLSVMRRLPPVGVMVYPPPPRHVVCFVDVMPALTVTDTNNASSS
jgi:hypothetical protein